MQFVLLDPAVATDHKRMNLVGHDNVGKRQVNIRVPEVLELNFYAVLLDGLLQSRQAILIEDTGLKRSLQHGDGDRRA